MPRLLKGNPLDAPEDRRHAPPDRHAETIGLVENNKNNVGRVLENPVVNRRSPPLDAPAT